jgi:predicted transcriptional regulator
MEIVRAMLHAMDTANALTDANAEVETEAERHHRISLEAKLIAEADAEAAAGLCVDSDEVKAWIETIGTGSEPRVPYPEI